MHRRMFSVGLLVLCALAGCTIVGGQALIFPIWPRVDFDSPPAPLGPYGYTERRIEDLPGDDGSPFGLTIFEPVGAEGPRPAFFWILGSNVQAYYHQSLHENLASWGYIVVVPDARLLTFTDQQYHARNTALSKQAMRLALNGDLGLNIDVTKAAAGGYSVGGTISAMAAADEARIRTLIFWAPSESPFWLGLSPVGLVDRVTAPSYYVLAELDTVSPADKWPAQLKQLMPNSPATDYIIPSAVHLYFQQPTGADKDEVPTTLTRFEQQGIAIDLTRKRLDSELGIQR